MTCVRFTKEKADIDTYTVDYSEWLPDGDTIVTAVATSITLGVSTEVESELVRLTVSSGEAGVTHLIRLAITTEQGRIKNDCVRVRVKDGCR